MKDDELNLFEIDPYRIADQWVDHPTKFYRASADWADKRAEHERCKAREDVLGDELKEVHSRLFLDVSKDPASFGLEKSTVDTIKAAVLVHDDYKRWQKKCYRAREESIKAEHAMNVAKSFLDTLWQMKVAMEESTKLHLNNIHAEPKARGEFGKDMAKAKRDSAFTRKRDEH